MKHARPLLLAASTLALFISACSQPADVQALTLTPQFGTEHDDIGYDVASSPTGQIYTLSETAYVDEGGAYDEYYEAYADVYNEELTLSRYDSSGSLVWSHALLSVACHDFHPNCWGSDNLEPLGVYADSKGYAYVLLSDTSRYVGDDYFYVYKVASSGDVVGVTPLGDGWISPGASAAVDTNGNIYVGKSTGDYDFATDTATYTGIVAKYSASGALQWQRTSGVGKLNDLALSSSGSVYVVGDKGFARYTSSGGLTWNKTGSFEEVIVSGSNLYTRYRKDVRKYDGTGKQLWLKSQTGLNTMVFQNVDGDGSGNVYLSGKYNAGSGNFSPMVRKLSSSGTVLWTKTYGTTAYDDARGIATISGSEVYVTGETQGSLAHTNRGGESNRDAYLRKLSSSGNPVWTR